MDKEELCYKAIDGISEAIEALEELGHTWHVSDLRNIRDSIYSYMDQECD